MSEIGILGSGSWGTALAIQFARGGHRVHLWSRRQDYADQLAQERVNRTYLPDVPFPVGLEPTHDLGRLTGCDTVFVVVPSHGFRDVVREFLAVRERPAVLVSATKGVEVESGARMSKVCAEEAAAAGREVRFRKSSGD